MRSTFRGGLRRRRDDRTSFDPRAERHAGGRAPGGQGSGIVWSADGTIVTCEQLFDDSDLPRDLLLAVSDDPDPALLAVPVGDRALVHAHGQREVTRASLHHPLRCAEPERLSGKWWDDDGAYRRDYWLCDSESGELLLFVDRAGGGRWYLQGWYD